MRALAVVLAVVSIPAAAAADPTAADVVAGVDKAYAAIKTAELDFNQLHTDATFGTAQPSQGHGWVARPSKVRWEYRKATGTTAIRVFVSDGKTLTIVDHKNKQVVRQAITAGDTLPAALSFLTGKSTLARQFNVALGATTATAITLELTPKQKTTYRTIALVVDPTTFLVTSSTVTDGDGSTNKFTFTNTLTGVTIDPKVFKVSLKSKALKGYTMAKPGAKP